RREFAIGTQQFFFLGCNSLCNISIPGNWQLQTTTQVPQCLYALLLGQLKEAYKDGCRHFGITYSTVAIGRWNLQMFCHDVEFEAAQNWQKAPRQGNGIKTIDGKIAHKQPRFIREEANIEADVMADEDGSIDKME